MFTIRYSVFHLLCLSWNGKNQLNHLRTADSIVLYTLFSLRYSIFSVGSRNSVLDKLTRRYSSSNLKHLICQEIFNEFII